MHPKFYEIVCLGWDNGDRYIEKLHIFPQILSKFQLRREILIKSLLNKSPG